MTDKPRRLSPRATVPGEKLRRSLGLGPEYAGTCSRLARARAGYQTIGRATYNGERREDYGKWRAKMTAHENRIRGLVYSLPFGHVIFGQDSLANWFAVIGIIGQN